MTQIKTERKGKTAYTEKINPHVPSGWCVCSTFANQDVLDPTDMFRGKGYEEKFLEHTDDEVNRLYATFPQQPKTKLTDVLKREHEAADKWHICV